MKAIKLASFGLMTMTMVGLGTQNVLAADPAASTKGIVTFTEPTGEDNEDPNKPNVVDPKDPEGPAKPVSPGGEGIGGNGKPSFNINWVSNFRFGNISLGTNMSSFAAPTTLNWAEENQNGDLEPTGDKTENLAPFLQVTDLRGTNAGWNVTVSGTEFRQLDADGEPIDDKVLAGATVTLNHPSIVGVEANSDLAPSALNASGNKETGNLVGSAALPILNADKDKGQGTWTLTWGADDDKVTNAAKGVQLVVPMTALPEVDKTYQADFTWTLNATPTE